MFISKSRTFETERLAEQQLSHRHDCVMRSAEKILITDVLFIDSLQAQLMPKRSIAHQSSRRLASCPFG
jgi:hypothetical protein